RWRRCDGQTSRRATGRRSGSRARDCPSSRSTGSAATAAWPDARRTPDFDAPSPRPTADFARKGDLASAWLSQLLAGRKRLRHNFTSLNQGLRRESTREVRYLLRSATPTQEALSAPGEGTGAPSLNSSRRRLVRVSRLWPGSIIAA